MKPSEIRQGGLYRRKVRGRAFTREAAFVGRTQEGDVVRYVDTTTGSMGTTSLSMFAQWAQSEVKASFDGEPGGAA